MEDICSVYGASWECEHRTDPERDRLVYVLPDGQTLCEYQREWFQQATALMGAARGPIKALGESIEAAASAIRGFVDAYDSLPDSWKEEMKRLDASP